MIDTTTIQVGDVLHFDYHYTACIPVFLEVTRVSKKSAFVRQLAKKIVDNEDGYGQSGTQVPNFEARHLSKEERYIIRTDNHNRAYITVDGHRAYHWDQKPKMFYGD